MKETDNTMAENSRARAAIPTTPKLFGGSFLVAGSHIKRTPMRISFGPPSSSDGSDGDNDSDSSGGGSQCTGAAAGDDRPMSLTERLQARKKMEGVKASTISSPRLASEGDGGGGGGCFPDLPGSSQVHVAASKMTRLPVSASSGTTKPRTPLRSVGNIENNKLGDSRSPFNKRNSGSDGNFGGEGWVSSPAVQTASISPPLKGLAVEHGNDDNANLSDMCNDRAGVAGRYASTNAMDKSFDLEQEERLGNTSIGHSQARTGMGDNSSAMDRGGGRRLWSSPQMDQTTEGMDDSTNLTDTLAADEISEFHRSLEYQSRNNNRVASAVASAAVSAVPAVSQSSPRARDRYSVASSVASSADLSHGDCGQTFPNNSDSVDGFDSASCHRNDDGYHSSASSLSSEDDFRSTSKNSCRRLGPNHGGNNGGGVSGSSSPAGVSTNARRSASTTMGGGSAAAAARIVVGSDFSDDGGSGSDDTQKIPSDFSLISAPRVSMGAAGAAARDGGGFDGGRYRRSEDDCEWQPATGNNYLWELQAKGQRGTAFSVPASLYDRMYAHQREGVKWLWQLHQGGVGGILGDDMGLGKTFQVCCLLAGLVSTKQASSALIIAPKSVLRGWEAELQEWFIKACCRNAEVYVVGSEMSVRNRRVTLRSAAFGGALGKGAVVICTYGIVSANPAMFDPLRGDGRNHKWDYVVLDEGHKIKNPSTKVCKAVHQVPAKRRLVLSGTPVQNNLRELHTVVDWATFGTVLGPFEEFQRSFQRPIENGQDKNASEYVIKKSKVQTVELRRLLAPHLLQRHKGEIMDEKVITKTEMVVWVALSKKQREIYADYLGGTSVMDVLSGKVTSPLAAIQHLKKVCLHPMVSLYPLDEEWKLDMDVSVRKLVKNSPKLAVLMGLVTNACDDGNRVLVFSRSVRMLDIIQRCLQADRSEGGAGVRRPARIDGSHGDLERQRTIKTFNSRTDVHVCLVSTGAGGTGITLTGADRVVLFDPSWNPADDMQAVDRAYRIGQTKDVVVYRMIAAGTVEEKMYEKQVFKDGLRRTIMGGSGKRKKNVRYFTRSELQQLFTLFPPGECRVLDQLDKMHGTLRGRLNATNSQYQRTLAVRGGHVDFLCALSGVYGASAHGDGLPKIVQPPSILLNSADAGATSVAGAPGNGNDDRNAYRGATGVASEEEYESAVEDYGGDWIVPEAIAGEGGGGGGCGGGRRRRAGGPYRRGGGGGSAGARNTGPARDSWLVDDSDDDNKVAASHEEQEVIVMASPVERPMGGAARGGAATVRVAEIFGGRRRTSARARRPWSVVSSSPRHGSEAQAPLSVEDSDDEQEEKEDKENEVLLEVFERLSIGDDGSVSEDGVPVNGSVGVGSGRKLRRYSSSSGDGDGCGGDAADGGSDTDMFGAVDEDDRCDGGVIRGMKRGVGSTSRRRLRRYASSSDDCDGAYGGGDSDEDDDAFWAGGDADGSRCTSDRKKDGVAALEIDEASDGAGYNRQDEEAKYLGTDNARPVNTATTTPTKGCNLRSLSFSSSSSSATDSDRYHSLPGRYSVGVENSEVDDDSDDGCDDGGDRPIGDISCDTVDMPCDSGGISRDDCRDRTGLGRELSSTATELTELPPLDAEEYDAVGQEKGGASADGCEGNEYRRRVPVGGDHDEVSGEHPAEEGVSISASMTEEFWSPPSPLQKQEESDTLTKEQEQGGQTEQEAPAKRVFSAVDDCEVAEGEHEKWKRAGGGVRGGVEEPVVGKRSDSFYSCSSAGGEGGMDGAKGEHRRGDGSGDSDEDDEWDEEEPAETRRMTVLSKRNNNEPLTSESATRRDGYASCSSSRLGGGSSGDEDVKSGNRRMTVLSNRDKILVPSDNEVCRDRNVGSSSRSSGGSSDEEVEPGNRRMTVLSKGNRIRLESSAERQDGGANGSKSGGGDDPILPPVFIGTQRNGSERSSSSRSSSSSDDDLEPRDRRLTVLSKRKQTRLPSLAQRDGSCKPSSSSSSNSGNAISGGGDDGFGFAPSAGSSKMTMINHADREQEQGGDLEDVDAGDALHTKVDHCKAKRVAESRERARVFASDVLGVDVVDGYDDGDGRSESMGSPEGERVQRLSLPLSSCELSPTQLLVAANSDTDSKSNTPIAAAIEQLRANENSCPAQRGQAPTSPPTSPNLSPVSKSSTITTNPSAFTIAAGTSALPHIPTDATANITTAASSCHDHVERLKPFNFQSFRCRCVAGEEAAEISRELLCSALEKEIHGKFHEAMDECLTAVELCDDDRELHEAVCRISVKIGTWLS